MKQNLFLRFICLVLSVTVCFGLVGCTTDAGAQTADLMKGITAAKVEGKPMDTDFSLIEAELAVKLFKASAEKSKNQNMMISPLSIQLALAMTANGADGQTKTEMEALLGGGIEIEELNKYLYSYVASLNSGNGFKLNIANSIWFRDDENRLNVKKDFLQTNADYYAAEAFKADFDSPDTPNEINNWVSNKTDNAIEKIIDKIDHNTVLYLINAILFDAEWQTPYTKESIKNGYFTSISGKKQSVKIMYSEESIYLNGDGVKGFQKNYTGRYSFVALLPDGNIYDYISSLDGQKLQKLLTKKNYYTVNTLTPKFEFDYSLKMNDVLKELGMATAFDSNNADFKNMATSSRGNIFISDVVHKTHITLDERGTKAGAVTKVEMADKMSSPHDAKTVTLDRPFIYMIVDNNTNLPIFMGTVTNFN